ncbi:flagellin N-terminal helical domain-containing protein [Aquibacillus saliphilus]|uniref:flagellin N-terminal helical domain-containing protein n=1 Tax=Aquibacillus saliphilus TaxID=1909422 RepID=UPI001CF06B6B|nr:flagellin [Aquibacillus saliphilus]
MRINHNIAALNTHRQLGAAQNAQQSSMEKLSSGLRINGAKDDAAGLAISEKMRGQIRGLDQATSNAQDANSLIQTAEGALNETHDILQRMRELATQSANDTNTTSDRGEIQKEVDQLSQELSRIGNTTEFNTQNLLSGNFEGTFQIGANEGQNISLNISDMRGSELGMAGDITLDQTTALANITDGSADGTYTVDGANLLDESGTIVAATADSGVTWTGNGAGSFPDTVDEIVFDEAITEGNITIKDNTATAETQFSNTGLEAGTYTYDSANSQLKDGNGNVVANDADTAGTFVGNDGAALFTLNTALTADAEFEVGGVDVSSQKAADSAMTTINNAIETVSAERSKLGAVQNRLDHTVNNLGTSSENLTAAESRIRDVDMAKEMMEQTKNSILGQASQAMLAQANQLPQGVLQLLQ